MMAPPASVCRQCCCCCSGIQARLCRRTRSLQRSARHVGRRLFYATIYLLLLLLSLPVSRGQVRDCSTMPGGILLRALTKHSEATCKAEHQRLSGLGQISGLGCADIKTRKCCRSSDCGDVGHVCDCASNCGVRTCFLDTTQALGRGRHCKQLLPPAHGRIVVTGHPGEVRVTCNSGHQLSGPSVLHCDGSTQKWSHDMPTCNELLCEIPRLKANMYFKAGTEIRSYARGEQVKVVCDDGYLMVSKKNGSKLKKGRYIKCKRNRNWQYLKKLSCKPDSTNVPPPTCCPLPAAPLHGSRKIGNTFCEGDVAQFYCKECYRLEGQSAHSCINPANYTAPNVRCEAITCRRPELPLGFSIIGDARSTYTCGEGLPVGCTGSSPTVAPKGNFFCDSTGSWRGLDSLRAYMCKSVPGPLGLTITNKTTNTVSLQWYPPASDPADVSYYVLNHIRGSDSATDPVESMQHVRSPASGPVTAHVRALEPDTQYLFNVWAVYMSKYNSRPTAWKSVNTLAIVVTCPMPELPNGIAVLDKSQTTFPSDSRVALRCSASTHSNGSAVTLSQSITCDENGTWLGIDQLRSYFCQAPPSPKRLTITNRTAVSISLQWRPLPRLTADLSWYTVQFKRDASSRVLSVQVLPGKPANGTVLWTADGLQPGSVYQFRVLSVYNRTYESRATDWLPADTLAREIPAPSGLITRSELDRSRSTAVTRVSWSPPLDTTGLTGYRVLYSTMSAVAAPYVAHGNISTTSSSIALGDLQPFTEYTVSVVSIAGTGLSRPETKVFTLKSPILRPRAPPAPVIRMNGSQVLIYLHASPDVHPFVWRYSLRARCDERDIVNSLEDNESTGDLQCPSHVDITIHKFFASEIDSAENGYLLVRLDLTRDTRFLPGRRYRVQLSARTKTRQSTWSSNGYFSVSSDAHQPANNAANSHGLHQQ
eukprot:scpid25266/ scgid1193/ Fibronectin; Anastellin